MYIYFIIILIIIYIYYNTYNINTYNIDTYNTYNIDNYNLIKSKQITQTIDWLYQIINKICYECKLYPIYSINNNDTLTYTEHLSENKGIINIILWDNYNERLYSNNTLLYKTLHEITNILTNNKYNSDFIETKLINTAINLGFYDINIKSEY